MLATARGVPWWGALACAVAAVLIGFLIDSARGDALTRVFTILYFLGCVLAVLIVRNRSLFTAMAQPPLLLAVAVPLAYRSFAAGTSSGLKSVLFDMALPLVQRFPSMIVTTLVVWVIGAFRITLYVQERRGAAKPTGGGRSRAAAGGASSRRGPRTRAEQAGSPRRSSAARAQDRPRAGASSRRAGPRTTAGEAAAAARRTGKAPGAESPRPSDPPSPGASSPGTVRRRPSDPPSGSRTAAAPRAAVADPPRTAASPVTRRIAVGRADAQAPRHDAAPEPPPPLPNVRYRGD